MLILDRDEIARIATTDDVLAAVEAAHRAVALGQGAEGRREGLPLTDSRALLIPMSAALGPLRASGLKILTDSPDNPAMARPRQQSVIVLLDPDTNAVEAILDGAEITMLRTAAASALATRHLSRTNSETLGLVGAGTLARAHLSALLKARELRRVLVWTRTPATFQRFAAGVVGDDLDIVHAESVEQVAAESDIICTLTPAREPILRGAWLRPGTHVNAVGAPPRPEYREIDTEVIARSRVVVDSLAVALHESGAIRQAIDEQAIDARHVQDELGHVMIGRAPGRDHDAQITLYNSVGLGIQDLATARVIVEHARRRRMGTDVSLTGQTCVALPADMDRHRPVAALS